LRPRMNKNTAIFRINIQQVSWAKPTLLIAATTTCPFPYLAGYLACSDYEKRSSETKFSVSDDLLPYQQPCPFPRPAGEG
ncbi:hypothetical protein NEISICOT_02630, partial [Neisseria sicca ATCC 29256]